MLWMGNSHICSTCTYRANLHCRYLSTRHPLLKDFLNTLHDDQAQPIIQDLQNRLTFINKVGLSYITLGQQQNTLSDGEYYRLHLAKKISTNLTDIIYLLEDPLSGLHPKDVPTLVQLIKELIANNNTVIATDRSNVLKHYAEHTIHLGPGSGPQGGTSQLIHPYL